MERIVVLNCAVLCVAVLIFENVVSVPYRDSHHLAIDKKSGENVKQSYLWFGPRLGRKKRDSTTDLYQNPDRGEMDALMDVIQDTPWAVVAINEGKRQRHVVNYTPRLGRESGEESTSLSRDRWLQDPEVSEEFLSQRSPPFAPRLGRHLSPFSPRLGRNNDKLPPYTSANNL